LQVWNVSIAAGLVGQWIHVVAIRIGASGGSATACVVLLVRNTSNVAATVRIANQSQAEGANSQLGPIVLVEELGALDDNGINSCQHGARRSKQRRGAKQSKASHGG
jgi:hypothetical protein